LSPFYEDELGTSSFERHDLITGHIMIGVSKIKNSRYWHIYYAHPSLIKEPLKTPILNSSNEVMRLADKLCLESGAILFNSKNTN
jgi:hypothetical protein